MRKTQSRFKTMLSILGDPQFRGKHIIVIGGKVHTTKTGKQANLLLDKLEKKYPKEIPAITFIPKSLFENFRQCHSERVKRVEESLD